MVDSILIRSRGRAIRYGIIAFGFALWLVFAPAGWPVFSRERCNWDQWVFARCIPLPFLWMFAGDARNAWYEQLRVDVTGFELNWPAAESLSFGWDELAQWHLTQGGWRETESEGGTKHHVFDANERSIRFSLVGGRRVFNFSVPVFGHTEAGDLLAVLRHYAGDREADTVVLQDRSGRTKRCT